MIDDLAINGKIEPHQLIAMQLQLAAEKHNIKQLFDNLSDEEKDEIFNLYFKEYNNKKNWV